MSYKSLLVCVIVALGMQSCFDPSKPNYQYFPNMYEPVGYETYADTDAFAKSKPKIPIQRLSKQLIMIKCNGSKKLNWAYLFTGAYTL